MFLRTLALASTLTFLLAPLSAQAERVLLDTSKGMIELELDADRAPVTVANFIAYVESGFYDGLTFHRVIPGFMIQGGGLDANMQPRKTRDPIVNESDNGLSNTRGSLAMARTADPDSATSQFFINTDGQPASRWSARTPRLYGVRSRDCGHGGGGSDQRRGNHHPLLLS